MSRPTSVTPIIDKGAAKGAKPTKFLATFADGRSVVFEETREFPHSGPGVYCDEVHAPLYAQALSLFPPRVGDRALDVGCGSGYGTDMLREAGYEATGMDRPPATDFARLRAWQCGIIDVDLDHPIHSSRPFALGVCIEVVEHLADPMPMLKSMAEHCANLYLTTPDGAKSHGVSPYHVKEYTRRELRTMLVNAGWVSITDVDPPKHHFPDTLAVTGRGHP